MCGTVPQNTRPNMTFRTHLIELDVPQERPHFPVDLMKIYIMVFNEFEAPPSSDFNTTLPQPDGIKTTVCQKPTNICSGFFRTDRRQYSCYEIWV